MALLQSMGRCGQLDSRDNILSNIPDFIDVESDSSGILAILDAIADELVINKSKIDEYYAVNDIDTTVGNDIDKRWGAMVSIRRRQNESDEYYRTRIKKSTIDMTGGTASAIKSGVAVILGVGPTEANERIKVIDAWLYVKPEGISEVIDTSNGASVCEVFINETTIDNVDDVHSFISEMIRDTKASGTNVQLVFRYNYTIRSVFDALQITGNEFNAMQLKASELKLYDVLIKELGRIRNVN